jgi:hypothetical protein
MAGFEFRNSLQYGATVVTIAAVGIRFEKVPLTRTRCPTSLEKSWLPTSA